MPLKEHMSRQSSILFKKVHTFENIKWRLSEYIWLLNKLLSFLEMLRRQTLFVRSMRLTDCTVLRKIKLLIWELNMDFKSFQWSHTFEYFRAGLHFLMKSLGHWATTFEKNKIFILSFVAVKGNSHNLKKIIWARGGGWLHFHFPVTKYHFAIHSASLRCPQFLSALTLG